MNHPRSARDIMATRLVTLSPDTPVINGIAQLLRHNITGAAIVDADGKYLGVFSEKCCMSVLTLTGRRAQFTAQEKSSSARAADFMVTRLTTLTHRTDVFEAIAMLLKSRVSGAPVLDSDGKYLGVFSEKTSMRVLIDSVYDQLPTSEVAAFMDRDPGRIINEDTELLDVADVFLKTPYRRLVVLRAGKLVGQISRRDVLRAQHHLAGYVQDVDRLLQENSTQIERSDEWSDPISGQLPSTNVASFMDTNARTITEDLDLLNIAQIFLSTTYRRLPVLRDGRLVGQVSRRDVLQATNDLIEIAPQREGSLLYLSSLVQRGDAPIS